MQDLKSISQLENKKEKAQKSESKSIENQLNMIESMKLMSKRSPNVHRSLRLIYKGAQVLVKIKSLKNYLII